MHEKIMKQAAFCGSIITLVLMSVMMLYLQNRTITYASEQNIKLDQSTLPLKGSGNQQFTKLTLQSSGNSSLLTIPVKESTTVDKVSVVHDFLEKTLHLYIDDLEGDFYNNKKIIGKYEKIEEVQWAFQDNVTQIKIQMNDIYECDITKENNNLCIKFKEPNSIYDNIIVIDAGHGGIDQGIVVNGKSEKKLTLSIIEELQMLFEQSDIKVYFTRLDDHNPTLEQRIELANNLNADMFISIHAAENKDNKKMYGINGIYNSEFFIPDFSGLDLADQVVRSLAIHINNRANGLYNAPRDNILCSNSKVPALMLEVGYMTNEKELEMLLDKAYITRIAEGIYNGIINAYEQMDY